MVADRRTPLFPRTLLILALLYWVLPFDLIPDTTLVPGWLDDLAIAVIAAKLFVYLCPDALVASHAAAVESRVSASLPS